MKGMAMGVFLAAGLVCNISGQEQIGTVRVDVHTGTDPVANAEVVVAGTTHLTDEEGTAIIQVSAGQGQVTVLQEGYVPVTVPVDVVAGQERVVRIEIVRQPTLEEEVTVVASTRTERRIEDQPMRVEVLNREEVEEKMLMTPGDIGMMLNEMGGLRVQATSPSLGAASVRIQGMRGRYTRFLSDGLPLFGSQPGGLGLLQIPPMDLSQVEVIKGVASALYGAGAMGGVVNLISRRPGDESEREVLVNQSTRGATDGVMWLSSPLTESWGVTFLGGGHAQQQTDVDGDGWADLAHYERGVARPRFFWDNGRGPVVLRDRRHDAGEPDRRHAARRCAARDGNVLQGSARDAAFRPRNFVADATGRAIRVDCAGDLGPSMARPPVWRGAGT